MQPSVSILIPVKNAEKTLLDCLDSIFNQTFNEYEVLIIDDHSETSVNNFLLSKKVSHPKLKVKSLPDGKQGIADALNYGIKNTSSEFILRMDADDIMVKDRLKIQLRYFENNPNISILGSYAYKLIKRQKSKLLLKKPIGPFKNSSKFALRSPFIHPSIMAKREVFTKHKYNRKFTRGQDYELWSRILKTHVGANIPEPLIWYECGDGLNFSKLRKKFRAVMFGANRFLPFLGPIITISIFIKDAIKIILKKFLRN